MCKVTKEEEEEAVEEERLQRGIPTNSTYREEPC